MDDELLDELMTERNEIDEWPDVPVDRASDRAAERRVRAEAENIKGAESRGPEHPAESGPCGTPPAPPRASFRRPAERSSPMRAPPQKPPPGDWSDVEDSLTGKARRRRPPKPAPMFPLNETLVRYARQVEKDLIAAASAPPDEALLAKLASGEIPTALELQELQAQVARRLVILIDHPNQMLTLARVMREVGIVLSSMTRRVQTTLSTSASLRAQRRFLRSANDK